MVFIDACTVDEICYLVDHDSDGIYDLLWNDTSDRETRVEKQQDGSYLLDMDGDSKWDHTFDYTAGLIVYNESTDYEIPGWGFMLVLYAVILLFLVVKRKKVRI
jgi:hypothetical protein